ncbi:Hypothetical predicted protein [Paramuricea clavata]|uniref:Uncharacterized protein n=1 Tax=Paramuricea clavata TaxID=317549 RepID=A0A6S7JQ93_PARCT|nr:Hypothetical predicted protein [Paramuricea clavata]
MEQLPYEVVQEFKKGNFVGKWKEGAFNEVNADPSLEWLNGIGKRGGGIVGITKTSSALSRLTEPLQQQPNNEQGDTKVQFTDTMQKNNALTFGSLYQVAKGRKEKEKNTILQADRSKTLHSVLSLLTELVEK